MEPRTSLLTIYQFIFRGNDKECRQHPPRWQGLWERGAIFPARPYIHQRGSFLNRVLFGEAGLIIMREGLKQSSF